MKRYTPGIFETLGESLTTFGMVLSRSWLPLLAVFSAVELVMAFVWMPSVTVVDLSPYAGVFTTVLGLTLGLLAVAIAIDGTCCLCCGRRDSESGGLAVAWGRAVATRLVYGLAVGTMVVVAVVASFVLVRFVLSPSAGSGDAKFGVVVFAVGCGIIALAVFAVWMAVRWMFAETMSVLYPFAGPSALNASSQFTVGRFINCLCFFALAHFVAAGIGLLPSAARMFLAEGVAGSLEPMLGGEITRAAIRFATGLCTDFIGLFAYVAGLVFIMRAEDRGNIREVEDVRLMRIVLSVLIAMGVLAFSIAGVAAVKSVAVRLDSLPKFRFTGGGEKQVFELPEGFRFAEKLREKDGELEIDSPFELRIGSTEYARQLGDAVKPGAEGADSVDTTSFGYVRLSRPYFGIERVSLTFRGAEMRLSRVTLVRGTFFGTDEELTLVDSRDIAVAIAADMGKRFGVAQSAMSGSEKSDDAAEYALERAKKAAKARGDELPFTVDFFSREFSVRVGDGVVRCSVRGEIGSADGCGNVIVSVQ